MLTASRLITTATAALSLLGCSSWRPVSAPLPEHLAAQPEPTIRITLANGQRLELDAPRATQDSVVGFTTGGLRARTAIALDQVTMVEYARTDSGKTLVAVLGTVGVVALGVYAAAMADYCADWGC